MKEEDSTPALLQETYELVTAAVDEKLISDATGRNALFKIHVLLGKIDVAEQTEEEGGHEDETITAKAQLSIARVC